jgi:glycosyltransferase involved in cell wall biosynthesis
VLAPCGEPAALADAIEPLLEFPEQRRAIAAAGRERFLAAFTSDMMCARMGALIAELQQRSAAAV